jgi:hypothetical protein
MLFFFLFGFLEEDCWKIVQKGLAHLFDIFFSNSISRKGGLEVHL